MRAVTVHDIGARPDGAALGFDLVDLLRLDERKVASSRWTCKHVECSGEHATELERISDARADVDGAELLRIASGIHQVIEGDFLATRSDEKGPWLVLRSIRGDEYVVVTNDEDFLARVRARFRDVRDSPLDAEYVG